MVLAEQLPETGWDVTVLTIDGDGASDSEMLVQPESNDYFPEISPDGRELFYRRPGDMAMMVAPIIDTEPTFSPVNPDLLFDVQDSQYIPGLRSFDMEGRPRKTPHLPRSTWF